MSTDEPIRAPVSEETPLLREAGPAHEGETTEQEPVIEERATKELILILGSIWLGVFLAALGMFFDGRPSDVEGVLTESLHRYYHCRDIVGPHLLLVQFFLAPLMASNIIPNLECRLPASQRPIDRYLLSSLGPGLFQRLLRSWQFDLWSG